MVLVLPVMEEEGVLCPLTAPILLVEELELPLEKPKKRLKLKSSLLLPLFLLPLLPLPAPPLVLLAE